MYSPFHTGDHHTPLHPWHYPQICVECAELAKLTKEEMIDYENKLRTEQCKIVLQYVKIYEERCGKQISHEAKARYLETGDWKDLGVDEI
jgi:hypothetical protein